MNIDGSVDNCFLNLQNKFWPVVFFLGSTSTVKDPQHPQPHQYQTTAKLHIRRLITVFCCCCLIIIIVSFFFSCFYFCFLNRYHSVSQAGSGSLQPQTVKLSPSFHPSRLSSWDYRNASSHPAVFFLFNF